MDNNSLDIIKTYRKDLQVKYKSSPVKVLFYLDKDAPSMGRYSTFRFVVTGNSAVSTVFSFLHKSDYPNYVILSKEILEELELKNKKEGMFVKSDDELYELLSAVFNTEYVRQSVQNTINGKEGKQ